MHVVTCRMRVVTCTWSHADTLRLHRTDVVGSLLGPRMQQAAAQAVAAAAASSSSGWSGCEPSLLLCAATTSLMWLPDAKEWLAPCCVDVIACIAATIQAVLQGAAAGAHLPPTTSEAVVEAVSTLYYLVQAHGAELCSSAEGQQALLTAATSMIMALQVGAAGLLLQCVKQGWSQSLQDNDLLLWCRSCSRHMLVCLCMSSPC
jgi:hypothetical protein